MFTELSLGCWSSGLYMYQVLVSAVFFFVSYMHIHVPFIMYCSRLFVVVFQKINCLNMTLLVGLQSYISPPSFTLVSAAVSEIRELNWNKKKSETGNFQFNTFLRQYRACVVESLGLGIRCVLYHCTMCTRHPDLVSSAIPIFRILSLLLYCVVAQ